jgi:predicted Zn-ribbon and HTH transcriptional regulator
MAKIKITVWGFRCERCGHEWVPHDINKEPTVCPKCKNPYWNQPRKRQAKKKEQ